MIDLKKFCAREEGRYAITLPWLKDGMLYATNGKICVRVKAEGEMPKLYEPKPGDSPPPNAARLFVPILARNPVMKPYEFGKVTYKPSRRCYCWQRPICKECGQEDMNVEENPEPNCEDCEGSGFYEKANQLAIDGVLFDGKWLARMELLNNLKMCVFDVNTPMYFTFDGGDGILMPIRI